MMNTSEQSGEIPMQREREAIPVCLNDISRRFFKKDSEVRITEKGSLASLGRTGVTREIEIDVSGIRKTLDGDETIIPAPCSLCRDAKRRMASMDAEKARPIEDEFVQFICPPLTEVERHKPFAIKGTIPVPELYCQQRVQQSL